MENLNMTLDTQTLSYKSNNTNKPTPSRNRLRTKEMIANLLFKNEDERKMILEISNYLPLLLKGKKYKEVNGNTARDILLEIGFEGSTTTELLETLKN